MQPPDPALGGGQDLGNQQVGAHAHLGELVAFGLGHEVHRPQLECLESHIRPFLGQRADHDHRRFVGGQKERKGFQAGDHGHLDVERDHVGFEVNRLEHRFATVPRRSYDLDLRGGAEQIAKQAPHQR